MESQLSLVPPGRLGALLAEQRVNKGLSRDELCRQGAQANIGFSAEELWELEHGFITLNDTELLDALKLYGVQPGGLLNDRARLVLDLNEGTLWAGEHVTKLGRKRNQSAVFTRYVSLLYVMRDMQPGNRIPLRTADLNVLSETFNRDAADISQQLYELMLTDQNATWVKRLQKKVRVPTAGILVGLTAAGSLVITTNILSNASNGGGGGAVAAAAELQASPNAGNLDDSGLWLPDSGSAAQAELVTMNAGAAEVHTSMVVQAQEAAPPGLVLAPIPSQAEAQHDHHHGATTELTEAVETAAEVEGVSETAALNTTVVQDGSLASIGAAAENLVSYNFRDKLPGWQIQYEPDGNGYRGLTDPANKTITIYVDANDTPQSVAEILAHEVGHALDVTILENAHREAWMDARDIGRWWADSGTNDFAVGAGDFAEAFAAATTNSPSASHHGSFSPEEIRLALSFLG